MNREAIIEKIKAAAVEIAKENKKFDYVASKWEMAAFVWHSENLSLEDRTTIMHHVDATSRKGIAQVRACYDFVQSHL